MAVSDTMATKVALCYNGRQRRCTVCTLQCVTTTRVVWVRSAHLMMSRVFGCDIWRRRGAEWSGALWSRLRCARSRAVGGALSGVGGGERNDGGKGGKEKRVGKGMGSGDDNLPNENDT